MDIVDRRLQIAAGTLPSLQYTYTADSAASVASIIPASAGAGKVTGL
jgi:pectate lyase